VFLSPCAMVRKRFIDECIASCEHEHRTCNAPFHLKRFVSHNRLFSPKLDLARTTAFGMGSAVSSALMMGATIALPAVGGIRGCGVPSERAEATLEVLKEEKCTLLFADTHTLKALPEPPMDLAFRGGVCKVGSGSDFLEESKTYGGVKLMTLGKKT